MSGWKGWRRAGAAAWTAVAVAALAGACGRAERGLGSDPAKVQADAERKLGLMLRHIRATDDQAARVRSVKDRVLPEAIALAGSRERLSAAFLAQWRAQKPDAEALRRAIAAEIESLERLAGKGVDGLVEVHAALTPAQREHLAESFERRAARGRRR